MARTEFVLTANVWTQIGADLVTVTLKKAGLGNLLVNTSQDDATAERYTRVDVGDRFSQNERVDTWAKATAPGWIVIVDEVGT